MQTEEIEFSAGGIWEEKSWYIYCNYVMDNREARIFNKPCRHCYENERHHWVCPFVVVAINEGGHNSTGVCLECIMEAGKVFIIDS